MNSKKYYAYILPESDTREIVETWTECEHAVSGTSGARYRGFPTRAEAEEWLRAGGEYEPRIKKDMPPGIYFDAGTGRGRGVEISVTDEKGQNLLHEVLAPEKINRFGKHWIFDKDATNNYGELLACFHALEYALASGKSLFIYGDSKLVIDYWSKGLFREKEVSPATRELIQKTAALRRAFEESGGSLVRISGDDNPADLGFHR